MRVMLGNYYPSPEMSSCSSAASISGPYDDTEPP